MSAHVQSALQHRFTLPVWLLAVLLAAAVAGAALLYGSGTQRAPVSGAAAAAAIPQQDNGCLDNQLVGHC